MVTEQSEERAQMVRLAPGTYLVRSELGFLMARQQTAVWDVDQRPTHFPCVVHLCEQYRGKWYLQARYESLAHYQRRLQDQLYLLEQHL